MSNYDENSEAQKYWNEEGGSKWAENIDLVESIMIPMSDRLLEVVAAMSGETVLDVGCGGGITSMKLVQQVEPGGKVLGVDVSEPILAIAGDRASGISNLEFQHCDAGTASLGENRFDIITSRFGVMFFDEPVSAFGNLHGALKPSGRLVFLCWRTLGENPWMAEPTKAAFEILPAPAEKPDPTAPGPFSLGDAEHLENILQSAGFNNVELQALDMGMPMGDLHDTVSFLLKMGPATEAMKEASEEKRLAVTESVTKVMEKYNSSEGVIVPSACWIVTAVK